MTIDQDRGAYAPHMDAPLAFDARRPSDRRPLPMTLIASAGVLVLIVGALALAYRGGVRGAEQPKLVGAPVGAIKTAAAPEAASDADSADSKLDVYAAQNVPTRPPVSATPDFAPAPEQPKPRAVAAAPAAPTGLQVRTVDPVKVRIGEPESTAAPVLTDTDRRAAATSRTAIVPGAADRAPNARPAGVAEASQPTATTSTKRDTAAATTSTSTTSTATRTTRASTADQPSPSVAKPSRAARTAAVEAEAAKPVKTAKAEAAAKASKTARATDADAAPAKTVSPRSGAAKPGAAAVQVGAFSSAELAQKGFADAGKLSSLGGHAHSVEKISRDGKTFYRATLGGFADKAAARAFCAQLTAKGGRCLVKS